MARIAFHCRACDETAIKEVPLENIGTTVGVEHKETCPFLKAIDDKSIVRWLEVHGYPIQVGFEK